MPAASPKTLEARPVPGRSNAYATAVDVASGTAGAAGTLFMGRGITGLVTGDATPRATKIKWFVVGFLASWYVRRKVRRWFVA